MRIYAKVRASAKEEKIQQESEKHFQVWVKKSPTEGKANAAVIKALARYLKIAPSRFEIISGHKSREKVFDVK